MPAEILGTRPYSDRQLPELNQGRNVLNRPHQSSMTSTAASSQVCCTLSTQRGFGDGMSDVQRQTHLAAEHGDPLGAGGRGSQRHPRKDDSVRRLTILITGRAGDSGIPLFADSTVAGARLAARLSEADLRGFS